MAELSLSDCKAGFTVKSHYEYPKQLLYLTGTATHPKHGEIATMKCLVVHNRFLCKEVFLEIMDEESQEMQQFAVTLFDKYGNVRPWLVDGGYRSGSGCWGQELNVGQLVYLEDLSVNEKFLRRGVGSWFLQALLSSPHVGLGSHVLCWPTPNSSFDNEADWNQVQEHLVAFFHKNGFRRIGRTSFMGYSPDPEHPSRKLAVSDDPDALSKFTTGAEPSPEEVVQQFPLHSAIATKNQDVVNIILGLHAQDPQSIHKADFSGFTPTYVAAGVSDVHALRTLLDLGVADDLRNAANEEGMTALDRLQETMRSDREFRETLVGIWDGYAEESLTCEYLLKKALGMPLVAATESEYIAKRKLGCTCGTCTDGWLSPKMRFRLAAQAGLQKDSMRMDLESFRPRRPLSEYELMCGGCDYLPPPLRQEIYKTFYNGWIATFEAVHNILKSPGELPTPQRVMSYSYSHLDPSSFAFYLGKGGKVEYVIDATIDMCREQSALGDATFEDLWESEEEVGRDYLDLPPCENDLEFGIVRRKLGLDPRSSWGPYRDYGMDNDEEMGMDEDEDEDED